MNKFLHSRKLFFFFLSIVILSCKSDKEIPDFNSTEVSLPFIEIINNEKFSSQGKILSRLTLKINHRDSEQKAKINGFFILCNEKEYEPLDYIKDELNGFTLFDKYILILDANATENCLDPKILIK